jgi:hypothetical protein
MKPMAAAAVGALIAGVAMYGVGARASQNPFADLPAVVQTVDGQFVRVPGAQPIGYPGYATALQPGYVGFQQADTATIQPVSNRRVVRRSSPQRTVYRAAEQEDRVVVRERADERSWKKTGLIIGGSAASGAGVGAIVGGKKGALIGAALGGGAASIYEATKH